MEKGRSWRLGSQKGIYEEHHWKKSGRRGEFIAPFPQASTPVVSLLHSPNAPDWWESPPAPLHPRSSRTGPLSSYTEKMAFSTLTLNLRNSNWLIRWIRFFFKPSTLPTHKGGLWPVQILWTTSPQNTHRPTVSLPEQAPWPQSWGRRAHTSWGFECGEAGRQRGSILSWGWEENRTLENCKAQDAKRDSSLSQLLTTEISPHLGMTSADLIFCHQSLCTCFNYAAHQQKFSSRSHKSHRRDTGLNRRGWNNVVRAIDSVTRVHKVYHLAESDN